MGTFDDFAQTFLSGAKDLARNTVKDQLAAADEDANDFLNRSRERLEKWTKALAEGKLTKDEFDSLVRARIDVAEINALAQAGAAAVRVQRFRDGLINLAINTAFKTFLP
jgi:hypothetical protein